MMRLIPRIAFMVFWALNATITRGQTSAPETPTTQNPSPIIEARPNGFTDINKSLEAQRPAMEAYYQCIKENEKAYKLYSITHQLIEVRQNRVATERLFAEDPKFKARYKNFDEAMAEGMLVYREAGGTAKAMEDITPVENPCPPPAPKLPLRRSGEPDSKSVVKATSSIPNIPDSTPPVSNPSLKPLANSQPEVTKIKTKTTSESVGHQVKSHKSSKTSQKSKDARECANLESDQAIMACAEKFR